MMVRSALSELRAHPGRFAAVLLAIVMGVGFAVGTLVATASLATAQGHSVAAEVSRLDVVVTSRDGSLDTRAISAISKVTGVRAVEPALSNFATFRGPVSHGTLRLTNIPRSPEMRWYTLDSGRWPAADAELAVDAGTAKRNSWQLGSQVRIGDGAEARTVTVVAILLTGVSAAADSTDSGYGVSAVVARFGGGQVGRAGVLIRNGFTAGQVADAINAGVPGASAITAAQFTADAVRSVTGGTDVLTVILLAFVALAGLVAAMVVANTFTILITARQRQIALLRCVGATGAQVRRSALVEALAVAVLGSAIGVGVGIGAGRIACALAGINGSDFTVGTLGVVVAALVGVVVAVIAALAPTARAMRIPPIAALRPVDTADRLRTVGRVRVVVGGLFFMGGGVILGGAVHLKNLGIAVVGGALTAVGVLLLLRLVLPPILTLVGRGAELFGVPGRLAVANTLRNPGRAAATCTALVVGVGAVVTILVASSSAQAGLDRALSISNPLDFQLSTDKGALPGNVAGQLAKIDGVGNAQPVLGTTVDVDAVSYHLFGPTQEQLHEVLRAGELHAGEVGMAAHVARDLGVRAGDPITLRRGSSAVVLKVASRGFTADGSLVVLRADLEKLDGTAGVQAIWIKFAAGAAPDDVIALVNPVVAPLPGVDLSGSGVQRAAQAEILGTLIKVALALLAVTVVIALVGIGNTLGLSVIERTRESALLRALGLRRRQLRYMLAIESGLLALVGTVVGSFFGVLFGWAAVGAAFGQANQPVTLTVPAGQLGMVLGGAVLAGVLASVVPARRAARATPTQALVEV